MPNTNTLLLKEKRREIMEGEKNLTNYTNFLSLPERSDKDGGTTQPRFKL